MDRAKYVTAEEAIGTLRSEERIFVGSGAAAPRTLLSSLVEHGHHLARNEILHILTLGNAPYARPEFAERFHPVALFIGSNVRDAVLTGRADYVPVFLSEVPELLRTRLRPDVALIQVGEPDRHGYASLGVSVDIVRAAIEAASIVIAEINPRMPRTHGDSFIDVDSLSSCVRVDYAIDTLSPAPTDAVAQALGRNVATLIPDGATLQTGIGTIPDAVLAALGDRHELGVHSEMISDGVMMLAERGVITGRRKGHLRGKIVTSFVMGSDALYRWVDGNPMIEMRPSDYTNDPRIIALNERMVSINSALAIDLTGQVSADSVGDRFLSGIGGQVDFVRGAALSHGGRSIIALRSTASAGISRICGSLDPCAGVTTSRGDVRYVVTEHGVADLWGQSVRQRAEALIAIAHPDFRAELRSAAVHRKIFFVSPSESRCAFDRGAQRFRG